MTVQTYYVSSDHNDMECGGCGAVVRNISAHDRWHERIEAEKVGR